MSYGVSGQIFGLISSFLSNRQLGAVLDGKSSQEYPVNTGVPKGSIHGPTLFLLYINDLSDVMMLSVVLLSMLMILSTLSMIRHLIQDFPNSIQQWGKVPPLNGGSRNFAGVIFTS